MIGYIYIIYKNGLREMYIGSTEDLEYRKRKHNETSKNPNSKNYNNKVYQFIRENGGFDSWTFEMIEQYECENETELRVREQYYLDINKEYLLNEINAYQSKEQRREYIIKRGRSDEVKERRKILYDLNRDEMNRKQRERRANDKDYNRKQQEYRAKKKY
jgi:hypothetical protein